MSAAATLLPPGPGGFVADPGTNFTVGQEPILARDLGRLGRALGVTIYGISGYRTPAHSVAVGGSANDPHTKGAAVDIGVNAQTRASAAQITEAQLANYGLYRPYDPTDNPSNTEVNHIQLLTASAAQQEAQQAVSGGNAFDAIGSAASSAANFVTNPGSAIVSAIKSLFSGFLSWLESNLLRGALYAALITTGAGLVVYGLDKALTGRQAPQEGPQ